MTVTVDGSAELVVCSGTEDSFTHSADKVLVLCTCALLETSLDAGQGVCLNIWGDELTCGSMNL